MKIAYTPDQEVSSAAAQKATGRPIEAWFSDLDAKGGVALGRKALTDYLCLAPAKTIKFTWAGKGHQDVEEVEIKFTVSGPKTSIVLNHTRLPDRAAADGMRAAWAKVLDIVKEKVA